MKIKNIKIKNFRCYYGEKNIKFSLDGKITFIYGLSGAGKSSFIDFINWMFYNKTDFSDKGKKDTHEIYNDKLKSETIIGNKFEVQGIIEFNHNNIDYQLIKTLLFERTFTGVDELTYDKELILNYYLDGSWVEYAGNVDNKINEIVPKSLSKYFFFHGEKLDSITETTTGKDSIKNSVYKLFGLKEYENAISHIGGKNLSQTVIYQYHQEKSKKIKNLTNEKPDILLARFSNFDALKRDSEMHAKKYRRKIDDLELEKQKIITQIGIAQSSDAFETTIKSNEKLIKEYERQINNLKYKIGNCFYSAIPYLMLSELTKKSVMLLSKEAQENDNKFVVFKNLRKELLKEILEKKECVCGLALDKDRAKHIQDTIDNMPPDSYIYILKQFGSDSTDYIDKSFEEYLEYDNYIKEIISLKEEILVLNDANRLAKEDLKKSTNTKALYEKLKEIESEIKKYGGLETESINKAKEYDRYARKYETEYDKALQAASIQSEYDLKIELLEAIRNKLEKLLEKKVTETKLILEESILEIYEIISTRIEDFTNKSFLDDDFALRNENLTGGQATIDVYSYIVGMIKALHKADSNSFEKEFPIIVDAPFSHCDPKQSNRVFNILPTIVPQVIMLTFATDIKNSLTEDKVGYCYLLKSNDEQTMTDIIPSNIEAIKVLIEEELKKGEEDVN